MENTTHLERTLRASPLLDVRRVTKRFGPLTVLNDVSLQVHPGEVVALVGETGAGKSTLVACVGRILRADGGEIRLDDAPLPPTPKDVRAAGVEFVWQEGDLVDDLDIMANITLGREAHFVLGQRTARDEALSVLERVGVEELPADVAVRALSRGQRQLVALGRAFVPQPRLLVLDEPTAPLSAGEALRIQGLVREARDAGTAILLVTHDLEQTFGVADRIAVLRQGHIVADVSPLEVQRSDVIALMSGIETDSAARRQLHRLRSLADQLSDVEPSASLSLIVSAMAAALDQEMLCVHLLVRTGEGAALRRSAAVGLPSEMLDATALLSLGKTGASANLAADAGDVVVFDDLARHSLPESYLRAAHKAGIKSEWAAPIVGTKGVLGTISGYGTSTGRPEADRLELARVYMSHAASAIEREELLSEVSRRNRVLESLRGMLEELAATGRGEGWLQAFLDSLAGALGAYVVAVLALDGGAPHVHAASIEPRWIEPHSLRAMGVAAAHALNPTVTASALPADVAAAPLPLLEGPGALVAHWSAGETPSRELSELLQDATRSLALAIEGEALERARREAATLRRSQAIQRELLSSLSHELRTPLTAIQGYASTLRQPDLTWDETSTDRFMSSIAREAARMERLVGDLLDASAIDSGSLRLNRDWCDLQLVVEAAVNVVGDKDPITIRVLGEIEPVWGDHDRLEQVLVNLLENGVTHGSSDRGVNVSLRPGTRPATVEIEVRDYGRGIPLDTFDTMFDAHVRGSVAMPGAGLGLSIVKGIVEAHEGSVTATIADRGVSFVVSLPTETPKRASTGSLDAAWNLAEPTRETDAV